MKYRKKDHSIAIFFQILMSLILIISCVFIHMKKNEAAVFAGAFGYEKVDENLTFSDLAEVIERAARGK